MTEGEQAWARCRPWIEAALEYGRGSHTLDDVWRAVLAGEAHFWPGERCAVVTEFHDFPQLRALHYWLAGGDLDELLVRMRPDIEAWGRDLGCTRFTLAGRPGWRRALAAHGYQSHWQICAKDAP